MASTHHTPAQVLHNFMKNIRQRPGVIGCVIADSTGLQVDAAVTPQGEMLASHAPIIINKVQEVLSALARDESGERPSQLADIHSVAIHLLKDGKESQVMVIPYESDLILCILKEGETKPPPQPKTGGTLFKRRKTPQE
ncbi:MAG: hypothetical protein ACFFBD_20280 [Candidatus Hodarchaeota archaeon]